MVNKRRYYLSLRYIARHHCSRRNITIAAIGESVAAQYLSIFHRLFCLNVLRMPPSPAPGRRRRAGLDANSKRPHGWKPPGPFWPNCRSGFRGRRRTSSPRDRAPAVLGLATSRRRRGRGRRLPARGAGAAVAARARRTGAGRPAWVDDRRHLTRRAEFLPVGWFGDTLARSCPAARIRDHGAVWVQTESAATVEVLGCSARTFAVQGHHYALVTVTGLTPDTVTEYDVKVDGELVWPRADSPFPPSVIRTRGPRRLSGSRRSSDRADTPRPTTRRSTPNSGSMRWTCTPPGWPRSRSTTGRRR